jgi:hypothetical protein
MCLMALSRRDADSCAFELTPIRCVAQVIKINSVGDAHSMTRRYKQYVTKSLKIPWTPSLLLHFFYGRVIQCWAYIEQKSESFPAGGLYTTLTEKSLRILRRNRRRIINLNTPPLLLPTIMKRQLPSTLFFGRAQPQPHQMPPRRWRWKVLVRCAGMQNVVV